VTRNSKLSAARVDWPAIEKPSRGLGLLAISFLSLLLCESPSAGQESVGKNPSNSKGTYVLARSIEVGYSVCRPFARNLRETQETSFDSCAPRLSSKFPRFSRPHWETVSLDLTVAERMVKRDLTINGSKKGDERWAQWLKDTEEARRTGKVKMWRLRADIDGNGSGETVVRMNYGFIPRTSLVRLKAGGVNGIEGCEYRDSTLLLLDGSEKLMKAFNVDRGIGDLIYDERSKRFFLVDWSVNPLTGDSIWGRGQPNQVVGATRGVALYRIDPALGPLAVCNIQWVPSDASSLGTSSK
jgi:hypothetical protein